MRDTVILILAIVSTAATVSVLLTLRPLRKSSNEDWLDYEIRLLLIPLISVGVTVAGWAFLFGATSVLGGLIVVNEALHPVSYLLAVGLVIGLSMLARHLRRIRIREGI